MNQPSADFAERYGPWGLVLGWFIGALPFLVGAGEPTRRGPGGCPGAAPKVGPAERSVR